MPSNFPLQPIPGPSGLPVVGNIFDIDPEAGIQSLVQFAKEYGPIFQMTFAGQKQIFICEAQLVNEVCDERRFCKTVTGGVELLRSGVGDGLFTAYEGERNWDIAHRILMPVFGPTKIKSMYGQMTDVAQQLCLKWSRYGPNYPIEVTDDFTRLTLDTIALCGFSHRFNSFYRDTMHPFIESMNHFLHDADKASGLPKIFNSLRLSAKKRNKHDINVMRDLCRELLDQRRQNPTNSNDLLDTLLNQADPKTGEKLDNPSIVDNMLTFLIAGHETTSGLLSFAFYYMLKNPSSLAKAEQEVDEVVGMEKLTVDHLPQLKYTNAILRETIRLMPTAPAFSVCALKDEVIGGKFAIKKREPLNILLSCVHVDKAVYGPDADEWKPERMLDEEFKKLPPNSWKPFGNGKRACIGRAFAWQEALLVIAALLQNFTFTQADPSYELRIKESLTIKPDGFKMYAALKQSRAPLAFLNGSELSPKQAHNTQEGRKSIIEKSILGQGKYKSVSIFYGSNSGTCEALSNMFANDCAKAGFIVQPIRALNSAKEDFTSNELVVIITATYDGRPTDNATEFVDWLNSLTGKPLEGVSYAVFGCGHQDWPATLYKIPIFVDEVLEQRGAKRIAPRGAVNVATSEPFSVFEDWEEETLWPALGLSLTPSESSTSLESGLKVSFQQPYTQRKGFKEATVTKHLELSSPASLTRKCHIELRLPQGMSYTTGDYLAVLPMNPTANVQRALARFHLAWDSVLIIESAGTTQLPTATPISVADLFGAYVELSSPASSRNIKRLAAAAIDEPTKHSLLKLANNESSRLRGKQQSVLDLLEDYESIPLSVEMFLEMLLPLRPRTYSISSAPDWKPSHATLTWSVLDAPSWSGHGSFLGVASNHLYNLSPGAVVRVSVQRSNPAFRLPQDPGAYPIIMIASGSGLAPFRAFLEERALKHRTGKALAPALLFFGCRSKDDDLYRNELDEFESSGIVRVRRAYSKTPKETDACGCTYVQDRIRAEKEEFRKLWEQGASIFVCGGSKMSEAVKDLFINIARKSAGNDGFRSSAEWFKALDSRRYVAEIFN
ncbi:hypothetical protein COCSADRAFT_352953 [Bipolaris sorokiniana ND90Pr]|uniref:Bifunctional cytochrome P450/NADPH--P450 reductase n=1 Tax=Cochliobolus sativus (strain ND90Pr / ATCC 201652) TaxID=665912 RepID=M2SZY8_COCSN|nr:uncharacterized protein COCSADRAFT_352953 [Bipolaris sorokiniana ND90Pr]EMD67880.1 hypothetical protein COCSADRAFT_352953 [Bipolaris sorokiniana ND90Pr]